jgi:hypothetical protein
MMNCKGCGKKLSWRTLMYYAGICLEELRKTTRNLRQNSRSSDRDLNLELPEYEAEV